jgi:hypothetical protein
MQQTVAAWFVDLHGVGLTIFNVPEQYFRGVVWGINNLEKRIILQ